MGRELGSEYGYLTVRVVFVQRLQPPRPNYLPLGYTSMLWFVIWQLRKYNSGCFVLGQRFKCNIAPLHVPDVSRTESALVKHSVLSLLAGLAGCQVCSEYHMPRSAGRSPSLAE